MPRKAKGGGRGGARQGAPGTAYPNRSDLNAAKTQPVRVAPSQTYGQGVAQAAAQQAIPLPGPGAGIPASPGASPGSTAQSPAAAAMALPGQLGPLDAPTTRPNEPITAGMPTGPGPGPEAIGMTPQLDPTVSLLKGLLARYPNADVQALLNQAQQSTP